MNTDARRRATANFHAKRTAEGYRKVTLWLSPEARFKLDALKAAAGSKDRVADAAIRAWNGSAATTLAEASVKPVRRAAVDSREVVQPKTALGETLPTRIGNPKPGKR